MPDFFYLLIHRKPNYDNRIREHYEKSSPSSSNGLVGSVCSFHLNPETEFIKEQWKEKKKRAQIQKIGSIIENLQSTNSGRKLGNDNQLRK